MRALFHRMPILPPASLDSAHRQQSLLALPVRALRLYGKRKKSSRFDEMRWGVQTITVGAVIFPSAFSTDPLLTIETDHPRYCAP
jgi:hypothetical protein